MRRLFELSRTDPLEYERLMSILKAQNEEGYQIASTYIENPELKIGSCYHFEKLKNLA